MISTLFQQRISNLKKKQIKLSTNKTKAKLTDSASQTNGHRIVPAITTDSTSTAFLPVLHTAILFTR